jgi:Zn-dependent protease with chaperone function
MNLDLVATVLGVFTFLLLVPVSRALARATWVVRAPRAAVALWQSVGLSAAMAAVGGGLCVAVARYHIGFIGGVRRLVDGIVGGHPLAGLGLPDALGLTLAADLGIVLMIVFGSTVGRTIRARARHRHLLNLLARMSPGLPATDILEHSNAVAYCLPGIHPRIVISSGTVDLLNSAELAAVLDHERGHIRERHGLVMLPMNGFGDLLRWIPYARLAPRAVAQLLEMAADDYSARLNGAEPLAISLLKLASSGHLAKCTFAFATKDLHVRMLRLLDADRNSPVYAVAAAVLTAALLAVPISIVAMV